MTIIQSIILGIVQGITEFLPISSSAHLVIVPFFFGWQLNPEEAFVFDVLVQLGTIFAVIVYFRGDLFNILKGFLLGIKSRKPWSEFHSKFAWLIIIATIPAGIAGLFLKDQIEATFANPIIIAIMLVITGLLMFIAEIIGKKSRDEKSLNLLDTITMGVFQAFAIFPGISRSGSTISGGLFRNLERKTAAHFSFLMSIPIMLAAGAMSFNDLLKLESLETFIPIMFIGFLTSAVVGYIAITWLMRFLTKRPLYYFSIYCCLLAVAIIIVYYAR